MDPKQIAKALGLKEDASEPDILAALTDVTTKAGKFAEAEREVQTFREKAADEAATAIVSKAITDKKIAPAQKEWATKFAKKDPEQFAEFLKTAPTRFSTDEKGHEQGGVEGETDARATLNRLALKKVSESKGEVRYDEALRIVASENPTLAKEAAAPLN